CEYVFSVPGEETMDVLEALSGHGTVRHVTTRHEQGAAFMADVYGRLTGRAAVAMATLGPGATNLVTGIADAHLDRAPLVAIPGPARGAVGTAGAGRDDPRHRHRGRPPRSRAPRRDHRPGELRQAPQGGPSGRR